GRYIHGVSYKFMSKDWQDRAMMLHYQIL
ncbi:MAG: hypothetical protein ucyna2_01286, partial [Candidatus Atelocyanobacterium thalassa isolate SIO64986]